MVLKRFSERSYDMLYLQCGLRGLFAVGQNNAYDYTSGFVCKRDESPYINEIHILVPVIAASLHDFHQYIMDETIYNKDTRATVKRKI